MIKSDGTQTSYLKSLKTREFKLFNELNIYLTELPDFWDDDQFSDVIDNYIITKDRDYVFYQRRENTFFVRFKNFGGEFSLCGSGLLALAKQLFGRDKFNTDPIVFRTNKDRFIKAKIKDDIVSLELVKTPVIKINKNTWRSTSAVYLQNIAKKKLLSLTLEQVKNFPGINRWEDSIGGYCAFFIEADKKMIHLRYFSPWHGRDEDFATLSIFEHLSDLLGHGKYTVYQNQHKFTCYVDKDSLSIY